MPARTAYAEDLQGIAVQGALRDDDPTALQQLVGLFDRELVVDEPGLQLVVVGLDHRPGRTVAIGPVRSHPLADLADQLVGDLGFSSACDQAADESGLDVAADRLSIYRGQPLDRARALAPQLQPHHLMFHLGTQALRHSGPPQSAHKPWSAH